MATTSPIEIRASFDFTRRQKHDLEVKAKDLVGDRMPFGKLWQDFLDGGSVGETVLMWWWATRDGHPDVTLDDVLDWDNDDYLVVLPDLEDDEANAGEESAVETGGSTTSPSSSRSSSSTESPAKKSSTGTTTS